MEWCTKCNKLVSTRVYIELVENALVEVINCSICNSFIRTIIPRKIKPEKPKHRAPRFLVREFRKIK